MQCFLLTSFPWHSPTLDRPLTKSYMRYADWTTRYWKTRFNYLLAYPYIPPQNYQWLRGYKNEEQVPFWPHLPCAAVKEHKHIVNLHSPIGRGIAVPSQDTDLKSHMPTVEQHIAHDGDTEERVCTTARISTVLDTTKQGNTAFQ